jgi:hypothetical protein
LFDRLGVGVTARNEVVSVGAGFVRVFEEKPRKLQRYEDGGEKIRTMVSDLLREQGKNLDTQHYLRLRRGPFVMVSVLDESMSDEPFVLDGRFIDIFDPHLPFTTVRSLAPNERTLLYDLDWAQSQGIKAKVVAAATRIRGEDFSGGRFRFSARGPAATTARARVLLPKAPQKVSTAPEIEFDQEWDAESNTLWLEFPNTGAAIAFDMRL